jgi:inorganic pyrophosphatase
MERCVLVNLWREIPSGDKPPDEVNAVIEVISRSRDKYEYHEEWEVFVLDRVIHSSIVFPVEYGFIPQTWFDDNDPLDIMVLSYEPFQVGCLIKTRPIGLLMMEDEKGRDAKILAVPVQDPRFAGFHDLSDTHPHVLKEIQEFFETYKRLEPSKWVTFKNWQDARHAKEIILYAMKLFQDQIG